jgi:uncharacterized protein YcnI
MVRKIAFISLTVSGLILAMTGTAFAHVTVDPPSAPQGGTVKLSFLCPNEEPTEKVTRLQIFFPVPPATPIPTVTVEPKPGWRFRLTIKHLTKPIITDDGAISDIVSEIDWQATSPAAEIGAHEFGEFTIDADGLPTNETQVVFKALQTYSKGDIVRWIQPVLATGPEAEHPTPILQLTNPNGSSTPTSTPHATATAAVNDNSARALAIIAIALGVVAMLLATGALLKRRRAA